MEFPIAGEDEWCGKTDKEPSDRATEGDREVEAREMAHARLEADYLTMTDKAAEKYRRAVGSDLPAEGPVVIGELPVHQEDSDADGDHCQRNGERAEIPAGMIEGDDEGEQVERERDDPKEGDHGDVLAHLAGQGEEQYGAAGAVCDPLGYPCRAG